MDLSALKQEIQDDAGLLSNWRKAYHGSKAKVLFLRSLKGVFVVQINRKVMCVNIGYC